MSLDLCPHECVLCSAREAKPHAQPRNEVRSVACGWSFMPAPGACRTGHFGGAGLREFSIAESREREAGLLGLSALGAKRLARPTLGGELVGELSRPAAQSKCRVSDSNGLRREAVQFRGGASRRGAVTAAKADRAHAVASAGRTNGFVAGLAIEACRNGVERRLGEAKPESGATWRRASGRESGVVHGPNSAETWRGENRRGEWEVRQHWR